MSFWTLPKHDNKRNLNSSICGQEKTLCKRRTQTESYEFYEALSIDKALNRPRRFVKRNRNRIMIKDGNN